MRPKFPTGTVTFLFTDMEGSTRLLQQLGPEAFSAALDEHRRLLRAAFTGHGGVEVDTQGDAFFVAFADARAALQAATAAQRALGDGPVRVRMGIHTGTPHATDEGYVGADVHLGARIAASGHGGQVLLSAATKAYLYGAIDLTDLGEHRLKDFAEPVWIYQLGADRFPPLKSISNTNLPRPASEFIGREKEVREIVELLRDGARLVTLTGPGGTGKTRLSIESASELVPDFRNGTFWIDLAALTDPALVPATVAGTIGAKDGLAEYIGEREMLLVLDNLEQVIESAPAVAQLVFACPNLRVIATSRERLRVKGETEYAVPPLAIHEAVELFSTRSGLEPDDTIAELCRRLDNLPLAVELAAARTSVLSPAQILERLANRLDLLKGGRDAEARQQTLRATIEWSYDLLTDDEKQLFARLGVFAGGWTLEAAAAVANADLDILQSLVEKSLVRHEGERFTMLETIRQYAEEKLEASGEADELRRHHADRFAAMGQEAWPHMRESYGGEWYDRIEADHDNLRAALDWLEQAGEGQRLQTLAADLYPFWDVRSPTEGAARLRRALDEDRTPTLPRARALIGAASLAFDSGDAAAAAPLAEQALALSEQLSDPWTHADAVAVTGFAASGAGNWEAARDAFTEAAERFRALGDVANAIEIARRVAWAYENLGEIQRARQIHEENYQAARAAGLDEIAAITLGTMGGNALEDGRFEDALPMLAEAATTLLRAGDRYNTLVTVHRFAWAYALACKAGLAAVLLAAAEALTESLGFTGELWVGKRDAEAADSVGRLLTPEEMAAARARGRQLTLQEAIELAVAGVGR
jgi:predicted ATPase